MLDTVVKLVVIAALIVLTVLVIYWGWRERGTEKD